MDAPKNEMVGEKERISEVVSELVSEATKAVTDLSSRISGFPRKDKDISEEVSQLINYLEISEEKQKEFRNKILSWFKRNEFVVRKKVSPHWAHVVQDFNKIHIYEHYAKKEKFRNTPIYGTLIAAYYEDYILDFLDIVNDFTENQKLYYAAQTMKFGNPLYPHKWSKKKNELVLEKIVEIEEKKNDKKDKKGIDLIVSIIDVRNRNPEEQIIIPSAKTSLRYSRENIDSEYVNSFLSANDVVERSNMEITKDELNDFYKCRGKEPKREISIMYVAALGISTILKLSSRKTGKPKGKYRSMKLKFYNEPQLLEDEESIFRTTLRMPVDPKFQKNKETGEEGYVYLFKALTLQEGKPILEGTFTCFSDDKFVIT